VTIIAGPSHISGHCDIIVRSISTNTTVGPAMYTYGPEPVINAIIPDNGPLAGGNTVTLLGAALGNGSDIYQVTIGNMTARILSQTNSNITIMAPPGANDTMYNATVYSLSEGRVSVFGYTYNPRMFNLVSDYANLG